MYLVGQNHNKELIDNGKLDNANFIIIRGPRNYGKTYLAMYIANHYSMDYINLDYKVDTIRQLVSSSRNNNNCLYHFSDFDKSSPAAKAALLKIAEETPKGIKIVISTSAANILDTLLSRGYVINMEPYSNEDISEYGNMLNLDNQLVDKLINGLRFLSPTILKKASEVEGLEEIVDLAYETIECINKGLQLEDVSRISSKFWKDDKELVLLFLDIVEDNICNLGNKWFKCSSLIETAKFTVERYSLSNYRNLVHNMLMEMV